MTEHAQISDRFTAVGEHHRQIDGDPARLMDRTSLPQPGQRITETAGQPRHLSDIGQQAGTSVTDHVPTPTRDRKIGTHAGTLHLESAFRDGRMRP